MFCRRNSAFANLTFAAFFNSHDLEVLRHRWMSASALLAEAFDQDTDDDTIDD